MAATMIRAHHRQFQSRLRPLSTRITAVEGSLDETPSFHRGESELGFRRRTRSAAVIPGTFPSSDAAWRTTSIRYHSSSRSFSSVFVSKHNQSLNVSSHDIIEYSQAHGVSTHDARTTSSHVIFKECPFCSKPTRNKADNLYKLYVQIGGGAYFCHRCGAHGSWFDYKIQLGGGQYAGSLNLGSSHSRGTSSMVGVQKMKTGSHGRGPVSNPSSGSSMRRASVESVRQVPPLPMPPRRLQALYSNNLFSDKESEKTDGKLSVLDYLTQTRGLTASTLRKYGVGKASYSFPNENGTYTKQECVTFSWIMSLRDAQVQEELRGSKLDVYEYLPSKSNPTDDATSAHSDTPASSPSAEPTAEVSLDNLLDQTFVTRRIKARALSNKASQRLDPPGGAWGFFGYHTIPSDAKEIVLCEGEYDAMAVWQATGRPAISLPNGCRSLPVETLPMLEEFERIYLWMDNDGPGQEGAELFSKKLGLERCLIVRPDKHNVGIDIGAHNNKIPKDANEALLMGCDLESIINDAKLTPHEQILTFDELRLDVLHEIMNPDKYAGTPMPSLPVVTSKIKGLRRGELTVLTGPTGSG